MGVLNKDIWHKEVRNLRQRNTVQPRRWGMMVTVTDDDGVANNTTWVLVRGQADANKNNNSNWATIVDWLNSLGVGVVPSPRTAYFDGDGAETEFTIEDPSTIQIQSVFVGGQRYREDVDYTKDNETKTVTFLGDAVPEGVGIDVEYFSYTSLTADTTEITADNAEITVDSSI